MFAYSKLKVFRQNTLFCRFRPTQRNYKHGVRECVAKLNAQ